MAQTRKNILVVDDVEDWQRTLAGLLTDEGYQVKTAGDHPTAIQTVKANHYDLAIIDIRLDESDEANTAGLDLAGELKKLQKDLPVVIITGYETPDAIARALKPDEYGQTLADNFVRKTDANELVDIVNELLGSSQA